MGAVSNQARGRGRELALLLLCHLESYRPDERSDALALFFREPPGEDLDGVAALVAELEAREWAVRLVEHVVANFEALDEQIEAISRSWRMARMDRVDRNVLRLATAELAFEAETPRGVILAEAVRLASRFGSERSGPFVNGIVEALACERRGHRERDG